MQNAKQFTLGSKKLHLVFLTTVGSQLHKLNLSNSDLDLKGVFVWDRTATAGLETMNDSLDLKNTEKEEWADLMSQLNSEFNLKLDSDDDLELWEAKKFFLTALKNDFNMFDMLFANETEHKFLADSFKPVLDNKRLFLNMEQAVVRFGGMARSALSRAKQFLKKSEPNDKEKNDFKKSLAKSLQFLFSLDNLLKTQTHNPVLLEKQRLEVLEVKKGNLSFEEVQHRFDELEEVLNETKKNHLLMKKVDDRETLNTVLSTLVLKES